MTRVFSSSEPKHWWAYSIGMPLSSVCVYVRMWVCMSTFLNISSEITGPIEAKFHMEPPLDGGTKVCSNGPGHMTKMAAMPIYGCVCQHIWVCVSTFLNISSEITGPIEAKFLMEPPSDGGTTVCSNGPGHMTKIAAMPIYGKNFKKSSSLKSKGR